MPRADAGKPSHFRAEEAAALCKLLCCAAVWAALPVYLYLDFKHILLSASWFEVQNFKC